MTFSQRDFQTGQVVQKLNALGAGGGGSAPFSVEDLDLEAYADKVPSLMQPEKQDWRQSPNLERRHSMDPSSTS